MKRQRIASLLVVGTVLCACGNDFPPATRVTELRLLAVSADPAQVALGVPVTLQALAFDPDGQPISYEWAVCKITQARSSTSTISQDCATSADPADFYPATTGQSTTFTLPAAINPGTLGLPDQSLGLYVPVRLVIRAPGRSSGDAERTITGIYRLRVHYSDLLPDNHNPVLAGIWAVPSSGSTFADGAAPVTEDLGDTTDLGAVPIPAGGDGGTAIPPVSVQLLEGLPLEIHQGERRQLQALFEPQSFETFLGSDTKPHTEIPTVRWFATAGTFDNQVTGQTSSTEFSLVDKDSIPARTGTIIDLWVIGSEDRNGVTWMHRQLIYR